MLHVLNVCGFFVGVIFHSKFTANIFLVGGRDEAGYVAEMC